MQIRALSLWLAVVAATAPKLAYAVPTQITIETQTTAFSGVPSLALTSVVTYDSDAAPFDMHPVGQGTIYDYAWTSWSATINGASVAIAPFDAQRNFLQIADNISDPFIDRFVGVANFVEPIAIGDFWLLSIFFEWEQAFTTPPTALTSGLLPTSNEDLAGFGQPPFTHAHELLSLLVGIDQIPSGLFTNAGTITRFDILQVPEPSTGLLVMSGLLGLAYRQKRRGRAA